jgi:hypothetical protein
VSSTDPHANPAPETADSADLTDTEVPEVDDLGPAESAGVVVDDPGEPDLDAADDMAESDDHLREAHALAAQLRTHAEQLSQLEDADLSDHVEFYQTTHAALQRALSDIDNA